MGRWGLARACRGRLRAKLQDKLEPAVYGRFARRFSYVRGDLHDSNGYRRLLEEISKPKTGVCSNLVFYLAIKPGDFGTVAEKLAAIGLNRPRGLHRLVVEKPFGEDLESARMLNQVLHRHFDEHQIYRIDHYLGKETVQNLMVFRFANLMVEPLWNRNYIDHVQITVAEPDGVETRAGYYDRVGALRDMLQNHLMQLLTLVGHGAARRRSRPTPCVTRRSRCCARSVPSPRRAVHSHALRAQYVAGNVAGTPVPGYQEEPGVEKGSVNETYVAAKFLIDNWRWRGVPFYLRTGKRLARQLSMIAIRFRHRAAAAVPGNAAGEHRAQLDRAAAAAGGEHAPGDASASTRPGAAHPHDAHERGLPRRRRACHRRLRSAAAGCQSAETPTNFIRFDEVEWAWRVVDPILKHWAQERDFIHTYPAGSWGPRRGEPAVRVGVPVLAQRRLAQG